MRESEILAWLLSLSLPRPGIHVRVLVLFFALMCFVFRRNLPLTLLQPKRAGTSRMTHKLNLLVKYHILASCPAVDKLSGGLWHEKVRTF